MNKAWVGLLAVVAWGEPTVTDLLEKKTLARIEAYDRELDGVLGVAAIDLESGRTLCYQCERPFPTASTIKVPLMVEVMARVRAGTLKMDQSFPVSMERVVPSSAAYEKAAKEKGSLTVRELVTIMIQNSDNTATNHLMELVGREKVNARMEEMGYRSIRLRRKMIDLEAARRDEENVASPIEMARLAVQLAKGQVLDTAASNEMLGFMGLVDGAVRKAVAPVRTATKTGSLEGVKCEFGIVFLNRRPFAVAVYGAYLGGPSPVEPVTKILLDHFRKLDRANAAGRFLE